MQTRTRLLALWTHGHFERRLDIQHDAILSRFVIKHFQVGQIEQIRQVLFWHRSFLAFCQILLPPQSTPLHTREPENANQLLEAGNYRALNLDEAHKIFQDVPARIYTEQIAAGEETPDLGKSSWLADILSISQAELSKLLIKAKEGPRPSWPRVLAALMRKVSDRFSPSMSTILWIVVWLI